MGRLYLIPQTYGSILVRAFLEGPGGIHGDVASFVYPGGSYRGVPFARLLEASVHPGYIEATEIPRLSIDLDAMEAGMPERVAARVREKASRPKVFTPDQGVVYTERMLDDLDPRDDPPNRVLPSRDGA